MGKESAIRPITIANWPISTPTLKPSRQTANEVLDKPRSIKTLAKPNPWINPNENAITQAGIRLTGYRFKSAAATIESAITTSTAWLGRTTISMTDSQSVMECATVNTVTIFKTALAARPNDGTVLPTIHHGRSTPMSATTSLRNRTWSNPIQMCHMPSHVYSTNDRHSPASPVSIVSAPESGVITCELDDVLVFVKNESTVGWVHVEQK